MADPSAATQLKLITVALRAVGGSTPDVASAGSYFIENHLGATISEFAPFAAHVARLYMSFAVSVARGLIGPRASNTIDLQYLFYAPFCQVFISRDKLHRRLWAAGAVTSEASFVWGDEMRLDLKERSKRRMIMTFDEWAAHRRIHGQWPEPIENSVISALWEKHCPTWPRGGDQSTKVRTIDDLDAHTREIIRQAMTLGRGHS